MDETRLAQIQALIKPILEEQSLELVELICRPQGRQLLVRVLVDAVGGVTLRRCAKANQAIGQVLEEANAIDTGFLVEVSSPGLDRSLSTRRDFERAIGEDLRVEIIIAEDRTRELRGMVLAVQPEALFTIWKSPNTPLFQP